ncbi:hypothetical protein K7X08_037477 [Anisodus acutangulus]|uniref:Uncharacterized protein n=1 Tax=Anisodus acutangulus TaxID=402998 RepID=A0A9Q1MX85_9SOLA|nr:hypothetical protein K7X08_037477 [Anisodus acutangulus]
MKTQLNLLSPSKTCEHSAVTLLFYLEAAIKSNGICNQACYCGESHGSYRIQRTGDSEEAARAYDQAAVLLRGPNTRTNFLTTHVSRDFPLASRIKNLLNIKNIAKQKSLDCLADSTSSANSVQSTTTSVTNLNIENSSSPISNCDDPISSENEQRSYIFDKVLSCDQEIIQESQSFDSNSFQSTTSPVSNCDDPISSEYAQRNYLDETVLSFDDQESQLFDDSNAYKPDLDIVISPSSCFSSFEEGLEFAQELLDIPTKTAMGFTEFEVMKVEREISASLYAVDGVQDYMEIIRHPYESLWDYPLSCTL